MASREPTCQAVQKRNGFGDSFPLKTFAFQSGTRACSGDEVLHGRAFAFFDR
jgi:hypothetical protein